MQYLVELPNPKFDREGVERLNRIPKGYHTLGEREVLATPRTIAIPIADRHYVHGVKSPFIFHDYPKFNISSMAGWVDYLKRLPDAVIERGDLTIPVAAFFEEARQARLSPRELNKRFKGTRMRFDDDLLYRYDGEGFMFYKRGDN